MHKLIHLVALYARTKDSKESKCSSPEDQFDEQHTYAVEYYTAVKRTRKLWAAVN